MVAPNVCSNGSSRTVTAEVGSLEIGHDDFSDVLLCALGMAPKGQEQCVSDRPSRRLSRKPADR